MKPQNGSDPSNPFLDDRFHKDDGMVADLGEIAARSIHMVVRWLPNEAKITYSNRC